MLRLVSEDDFLKKILPLLSEKNILSGNDDAVAWKTPEEEKNSLVVLNTDSISWSTDALPLTMTYFEFGKKLVSVTVSDVIAKGAKPYFFLGSIVVSSDLHEIDIIQLVQGLLEGCKMYDLHYLGGDVGTSKEPVLTGIVVGYVKEKFLLKRSTVKEKDFICSTGYFGYTGLGFNYYLTNMKTQLPPAILDIINQKLLNPKARLDWLELLRKYANATIDSSDGLAKSLQHLANESGKKIVIQELPAFPELENILMKDSPEYNRAILFAGEELEIIFSITENNYLELLKEMEQKDIQKPIVIAEVKTGEQGVFYKKNKVQLQNKWDSFHGFIEE